MTALIWKEIRQNFVWALLALLAMSIGATVAVQSQATAFMLRDVFGSVGVNTLGIVGPSAVALLLGLCQTLSEGRRDQWAYLVHRPISRTRIFAAKTIAGLILYLLAGGLPLAGAWLWVATPNHVPAPFDPRMLLASAADLLAGSAWYFAAFAVGAREARWYASRITPLGLAFIASCAAVVLPEFWMAAAGVALLAASLALAAWGSFTAGGAYGPQPPPARLALGSSVAVGITLLGTLALGLLSQLLPAQEQDWTYSLYQVTRDGQVLAVTRHVQGRMLTETAADLEGHPQTIPSPPPPGGTAGLEQQSFFVNPTFSVQLNLADLPLLALATPGYRSPSRYFPWSSSTPGPSDETRWYFSARQRVIFVYDARSAHLVGTIGSDGRLHAPQGAAAPAFASLPVDRWSSALALPDAVWQPNPATMSLECIYRAQNSDPVLEAEYCGSGGQKFHGWLIVTSRNLHILDEKTRNWTSLQLEHTWPQYASIFITSLPDSTDRIVQYNPNTPSLSPAPDAPPIVFQRIAPDGRVLWTKTAPPTAYTVSSRPTAEELASSAIVPPVLAAAWAALMELERPGVLRHLFPAGDAVLLLVSSGAALSAVGCWMLTRRYAMSRAHQVTWALLGLALGALSILLLICLHELPARIACPSCGRKRVVTRDTCEHCGAPFPAPALKGIEIFCAPDPQTAS